MKIIVTGGAGFIGSHLVRALVAEKHEVHVIDDMSAGRQDTSSQAAKTYNIDVSESESIQRIFEQVTPDAVFHLAAQISVPRSIKEPLLDIHTNVLGTVNIALASSKTGVRRMIFSSSGGALYGECVQPATEGTLANPKSPYGVSKMAAEMYLDVMNQSRTLQVLILRYANVFGQGQELSAETGVIGVFCQKLLKKQMCTIYGDGTSTRDYVYVKDVVTANMLALHSSEVGTFNVSTGVATTTAHVYDDVATILGSKLKPHYQSSRHGEILHSVLNSEKAYRVLGWKPKFNLKSGLADMMKVVRMKDS